MKAIPADIIAHCEQYQGCKGCPLRTCTAPLADAGSPKWDEWIEGRISAIRALKEAA